MSIYSDYVNREPDLQQFIDNAIINDTGGRTLGWGEYYKDHKQYLDGLWSNLSEGRKKIFEDKAKETGFAIFGQVKPNVYSPSEAGKRMMARDWHKGLRYFAGEGLLEDETVVGMEGGSGKERGLDTYTVLNHEPVDGIPVKNVVRLNAEGDNYKFDYTNPVPNALVELSVNLKTLSPTRNLKLSSAGTLNSAYTSPLLSENKLLPSEAVLAKPELVGVTE